MLKQTLTWNFGKVTSTYNLAVPVYYVLLQSELYHWIEFEQFDQILSDCTQLPPENPSISLYHTTTTTNKEVNKNIPEDQLCLDEIYIFWFCISSLEGVESVRTGLQHLF